MKTITEKRKSWLVSVLANAMNRIYKLDDLCYSLNQAEQLINDCIYESNETGIEFLNTCTPKQLIEDLL